MYDLLPVDAEATLGDALSEETTRFPVLRPKLLAEAARFGARMYRRARDLPAALPGIAAGSTRRLVAKLAETEATLEASRRAGAPGYRSGRHVQVLSALLAESARLAQE